MHKNNKDPKKKRAIIRQTSMDLPFVYQRILTTVLEHAKRKANNLTPSKLGFAQDPQ